MTFIATPSRACSARTPRFTRLAQMFGIWRQRRALEALDDSALEDIGLTRSQAEAEARRPLWDAPESWRC